MQYVHEFYAPDSDCDTGTARIVIKTTEKDPASAIWALNTKLAELGREDLVGCFICSGTTKLSESDVVFCDIERRPVDTWLDPADQATS